MRTSNALMYFESSCNKSLDAFLWNYLKRVISNQKFNGDLPMKKCSKESSSSISDKGIK